MIQRIQTIFWLLAELAIATAFFFPIASLINRNPAVELWLTGYKEVGSELVVFPTWPLFGLCAIILILTFVTIFLFKHRVLQMRLTIYNILLTIGLVGLGIFYGFYGARELEGEVRMQFISIMPVVAVVLNILAWRGVRRDYYMLKAVDRIR